MMKSLFLTLCLLSGAVAHAAADGQVVFENVGGQVDAPVYDGRTGELLAGDGTFVAQLYAGVDQGTLLPVPGTATLTLPGYFFGDVRTVPGVPGGTEGFFQVKVWELAAGATFEEAALNEGVRGSSSIFSLLLPDTSILPPPLPASLMGLTSFAVVPEQGPVILAQPENQTVPTGETASFQVSASGQGPLQFQWRLNGTNLPGATNATLTLVDAQADDAGFYSVRVTDQVGSIYSLTAHLTVLGFVQAQIANAPVGGTVVLPIGTFLERIVIDKNLTLVGAAGTILDGGGVGTVVEVSPGVEVTLLNLTIRHGGGAGLYNAGTTHLSGVSLLDNAGASARGGGLWNIGTAVLSDSVVKQNGTALSTFGGGIYNGANSVLVVSNSWIVQNQGLSGGIHNEGMATVVNSTLSENTGRFGGGGLGNYQGTLVVENSTLSSNSSNEGGALYNFATATLRFATVTANHAQLTAAGIWSQLGSVTLLNSILANNTLTNGTVADCFGGLTSAGHNLFGTTNVCAVAIQGSDLLGQDPMLSPLAENGGPTPTHALMAGSPALDAADCGTFTTDQRGVSRVVNAGLGCDIGAFELAESLVEGNFVVQATLGAPRNNFNGQVGMKIRVGAQPVTVTGLGRIVLSGNSGSITVRIVRVMDLAEVASVAVNLSGGTPGQFQYGHLDVPVTLAANTSYYVVSVEAFGGNTWADYVGTHLTVTDVATVQAAVYFGSGFGWTEVAGPGSSYVPCDFLYLQVPPEDLVTITGLTSPAGGGTVSGGGTYPKSAMVSLLATPNPGFGFANWTDNGAVVSTLANYSFIALSNRTITANFTNATPPGGGVESNFVLQRTLGNPRNDFTGQVGVKFLTGNQPLTVTALGRIFLAGNSGAQTVRIVRVSDLSQIASVSVPLDGGSPGLFRYGTLASPVVLAPNTAYYLVGLEVLGGNLWSDYVGTLLTVANVASVQGAVYFGSGFGWTEVPGGTWSYGPYDFKYMDTSGSTTVTISASPNPSGAGTVTGAGTFASGAAVSLGASANAGFAFANWTQDSVVVSTVPNYMFTAVSNRTLVANFTNAPVTYTISTLSSPAQGGNTSGGGSYAAGASVTVMAAPNAGYGFAHWAENGSVVSTAANYLFTALSNRTLTATFTNNTPPPSGQQNFVLQKTLGQPRNDFNGQVGMKVRIGSQSITVVGLGRIFLAGNSGVSTVRIVRANDLVEVASTQVTLSGGSPGQFQYAPLAAPVTLSANTSYYVVSVESYGGNLWSDYVGTVLTVANVATVQGAVYFGSGYGWTEVAVNNLSYVPCDFQYVTDGGGSMVTITASVNPVGAGSVAGAGTFPSGSSVSLMATANAGFGFANWTDNGLVVSTSSTYNFNATSSRSLVANFTNTMVVGGTEKDFVTGVTLGSLRSDGGAGGFRFTVGPKRLLVKALARFCAPGNSRTHELRLVQANGTDIPNGSVTVNLAGATPGQFVWGELATPVTLQANTTYELVSAEGWFTDAWYDATTAVSTTGDAVCNGAGYLWYGWNSQGGANTARGPLNFRYIAEESAPAGGGLAALGGLPQLQMSITEQGRLVLHITAEPGQTLALEATDDFISWTAVDAVTLPTGRTEIEITPEQPRRFWRVRAD